MGIKDFLKRGMKEMMIARPDEAKDYAIYKHPDQTVPTYAQLTVDSDEDEPTRFHLDLPAYSG